MDGINELMDRIDSMPVISDKEAAERREREQQRNLDSRIAQCRERLRRDSGRRYGGVSLDNFQCSTDEQKQVVERLRGVGGRIGEFVRRHHQLFFWGSIGSGKDHLAVSLLKIAAAAGISARWKQGTEVYDRIAGARDNGEKQSTIYRQMWEPKILCLSDPVFDRNFTPAKQDALAKIVRGRYDRSKTTWVTMNCGNLEQAQQLLGPDVYDRLREKAIMIECKWASFRRQV